jgi:pimeloyl-ACP methyl ester carboxylesterase
MTQKHHTTAPQRDDSERAAESRAAAALLGEVLAGTTRSVAAAHRQASDATDAIIPPWLRPWRRISRPATSAIYATVAAGVEIAPAVAAVVADVSGKPEAMALSKSPRGRAVLSVADGFWSSKVRRYPELSIQMAVRVANEDLPLTPTAVAEAFPHASGHLVIYVHGLVENDEHWRRAIGTERLPGATPVVVRYPTGDSIDSNAAAFADLVADVIAAWPTPVDTLDLIGHSMGGLVVTRAIDVARERDLGWPVVLRHTITLGTPHHGAPLARLVHGADRVLTATPVVSPVADYLWVRTPGVRDLERNPHESRAATIGGQRITAVSSSRFGAPDGLAARVVGDGVVPLPSAAAAQAAAWHVDHRTVQGVGHVALLDHASVEEVVAEVLAGGRAGEPSRDS